jgi:hypothetical protein
MMNIASKLLTTEGCAGDDLLEAGHELWQVLQGLPVVVYGLHRSLYLYRAFHPLGHLGEHPDYGVVAGRGGDQGRADQGLGAAGSDHGLVSSGPLDLPGAHLLRRGFGVLCGLWRVGGGAFDRGSGQPTVAEAMRQDACIGSLPSVPPLEHLPCHLVHFALSIFICRRGLA